ncbi:uncharacterized protein Dyak_GE27907, isoform A [Drosophila yakuba]|uniref:Uncharacterized protein, isoform A n=1 Tax=Drosophila yakuba TaxID=7245 RepID=A0A0R1DQW0_DROYA|nr:uncharacterized protein Dyak_GE27907, isoform A [Drosophila yakuba]
MLGGGWSSWTYYRGPFIILSAINIIMFVLTIKHITKTKREINNLTKRQNGTTRCLTVDFQKAISYLRIFAIMGGSWILFLVSMQQLNKNVWKIVVVLIQWFHFGFGIVICVLLIFKRSTYRLLFNKKSIYVI